MNRKLLNLALPLLLIAQCAPGGCQPPDPGYALRHDFSLSPGLQEGYVTSCMYRASEVAGREHLCRIVHGYEEVGDASNYHIDAVPSADPASADHVLAAEGSNDSAHGMAIVLDDGTMYEGCRWTAPSNDYDCDYRVRGHTVLRTGGAWDYFLRKAWDWFGYAGDNLGCAAGIVGIWYGRIITLPTLIGCVDGPL